MMDFIKKIPKLVEAVICLFVGVLIILPKSHSKKFALLDFYYTLQYAVWTL